MMVQNCIYCNSGLKDNSVVDVCWSCGLNVWGEKMFVTIIKNMSDARDSGDLYQGSVTEPVIERTKLKSASNEKAQTLKEQQNKQFSAEELLSSENELVFTPEIEDPSFSNLLP